MKTLQDFPTHEIRAVGPGPQPARLRAAYLELLKLALCDLAGTGTVSVGRMEDDRVFSRELAGEQLQVRANGMDWPLNGLTMIGLARLNDLHSCVESAIAEGVEGDLIEAGTWRGGASILMRATLDSLGADDRTVWVADSFQGFPKPDAESYPEDELNDLDMFDYLAVPLDEVRANFARFGCERGVRFVPGFFEQTMPGLRGHRWSLVRLDGDTYESTWLALESLYPGLALGGHLIVDDYGAFEECRRAVDDFRREHGIEEPLEQVDWASARWRRASGTPIESSEHPDAPDPDGGASARAVSRRGEASVPSLRELELERELAQARAEIDHLRRPALARAAARARRRLGRSP
jgi:O-methyltransferase